MMLILGLVLSFFIGFKAAMTSVVPLTTLAVVAHTVGHGLFESRPVAGEKKVESVNDQTSGKPGA
jgi:quinol-cytochrome oxidoreductase complex cytochrome b subunit